MSTSKLRGKTEPFLWGAAAGALVLAVVGFGFGGWVVGSTAQTMADDRSEAALVAALTPICVAQFRAGDKPEARLAAMKKVATWQQSEFVAKGGWATMPGAAAEPNHEVATACAEALNKLSL